jgi:molecular chaperone GrpE
MNTDESGSRPHGAGGPDKTPPPGEGGEKITELEHLKQQLSEASERARVNWEHYLRAAAELENVRKRAQRDIEAAHRYGLEKLVAELLPVRDSLELAVQNASMADAASMKEGQEATLKLLGRALEKLGVTLINPQDESFDPGKHEAVLAQESASVAPGAVLTVLQPGYELNGRVLRPARVIVAKAKAAEGAARTEE